MARIFRSSVIDAPAEAVWARIRDFNGLPGWHPAIATSETHAACWTAGGSENSSTSATVERPIIAATERM